MTRESPNPFTPGDFTRLDESDDSLFYQEPRLVVHIDDQAISAIGQLFKDVIPPNAVVLDLMSSWRSHWPVSDTQVPTGGQGAPAEGSAAFPTKPTKPTKPRKLVGLGLNAVEMQHNPDLDDYLVHDVNRDPHIPFEDSTFDAVVITVSIQYLTRPIEVFRHVHRVLNPGGLFLVIFSNRMFPTKAIRIWVASEDEQRMGLVAAYFHFAGGYEKVQPMYLNPGRRPIEDPVYALMARKPLLL